MAKKPAQKRSKKAGPRSARSASSVATRNSRKHISVQYDTRVRVDLYRLISDAVEKGAEYGCRRFWKHRDDAPDETVLYALAGEVSERVMDSISEYITFPFVVGDQ